MAAAMDDEDEWEYEYDLDSTEPANKKQKTAKGKEQVPLAQNNENVIAVEDTATTSRPAEDAVVDGSPEPSLQILDLHTNNPVVSYGGQVYSCTWTDTIGTTMFFSQPRAIPMYDADIQTKDFDMIGLSRIKLVGRGAKVTRIEPSGDQDAVDMAAAVENPGQSLGTIKRGNAKLNADLRKQANFLEQLMNIKKNRGEKDNVRVVMNDKIGDSLAQATLKVDNQRYHDQIEQLNRQVVRGDADALAKLEQIYTGRHLQESEEEVEQTPPALRSRPARRQPRKRDIPDHREENGDDDDGENESRPRILGTASPSPSSSPSQAPSATVPPSDQRQPPPNR